VAVVWLNVAALGWLFIVASRADKNPTIRRYIKYLQVSVVERKIVRKGRSTCKCGGEKESKERQDDTRMPVWVFVEATEG